MEGCEGMRKLICVKDVDTAEKHGQKVVYINCDTIVTPSAKDAARNYGIEFSDEPEVPAEAKVPEVKAPETKVSEAKVPETKVPETKVPTETKVPQAKSSYEKKASELEKVFEGEVDTELAYRVFKIMMDKGLLNGVIDLIANKKPYLAETDPNGLKIVRGNSVKYKALDTGNPNDKVFYQEFVNADDGSSMNAGFITIENSNFDWKATCQELYYVVEGTLTVAVDGNVHTAHPGDSVFLPKGAKVALGSPDKMKAFYTTY